MVNRRGFFGGAMASLAALVLPRATVTAKPQATAPATATTTIAHGTPIRMEIGAVGVHSKVFIGDVELTQMCRAARVDVDVDSLTRVTLELLATGGVTLTGRVGAIDADVYSLAQLNDRTGDPLRIEARGITKASRG
jgi:hypothetical protein